MKVAIKQTRILNDIVTQLHVLLLSLETAEPSNNELWLKVRQAIAVLDPKEYATYKIEEATSLEEEI